MTKIMMFKTDKYYISRCVIGNSKRTFDINSKDTPIDDDEAIYYIQKEVNKYINNDEYNWYLVDNRTLFLANNIEQIIKERAFKMIEWKIKAQICIIRKEEIETSLIQGRWDCKELGHYVKHAISKVLKEYCLDTVRILKYIGCDEQGDKYRILKEPI